MSASPVAPAEPVDAVVGAVLAVPGVAALSAGPAGSAATLLAGRRVDGVALRPTGTEVHVAVDFGVDVRATARAVVDAVSALGPLAPAPVRVHVEDVVAPSATPARPPSTPLDTARRSTP